MNTKIKTIAMLVAMIIGTLAANAQSARRGDTQKRTSTTSKTYSKPSTKSKSTTARQATTSRSTQSKARSVQRTQPQRATTQRATRGPVAQTQTRTSKPNARVQTQSKQRKSTTSRYNPKSTYRKADKTVHTGKTYVNPKPGNNTHNNNKVYKGNKTLPHNANTKTHYKNKTHHRHYYYPVDRVKIHVHPMTYRGNYRALYYPRYSDVYWSRSMRRHYVALYPGYTGWHYNYGYRIQTMTVFDARYNAGEIARVYGRVYATWHNPETDDLLLFFGGEYPNQVFTMILPGNVARRYSWRPERYFLGQHVSATGLITQFEGQAEMVVKKRSQIDVY